MKELCGILERNSRPIPPNKAGLLQTGHTTCFLTLWGQAPPWSHICVTFTALEMWGAYWQPCKMAGVLPNSWLLLYLTLTVPVISRWACQDPHSQCLFWHQEFHLLQPEPCSLKILVADTHFLLDKLTPSWTLTPILRQNASWFPTSLPKLLPFYQDGAMCIQCSWIRQDSGPALYKGFEKK